MDLLKDRHEAGLLLAEKLSEMNLGRELCVLALPRGGVPVAWEISQQLKCPLDLLFIKKIGAPGQQELAIGAISEDADIHWQRETIDYLKIPHVKMQELAQAKKKELQAQVKKWRAVQKAVDVERKIVIVVDDGLATGATMIAALQFLRKKRPQKIIVAIPVASETAVSRVAPWCDEMLYLETPTPFFGVGQWYKDFTQVTDEEVRSLLGGSANELAGNHMVLIPHENILLEGELTVPSAAKGLIIFAHGSGSTHRSPRNQKVGSALNQLGFATLLFDLLTPAEAGDRANIFNIPLLVE
ncbi:MAG: phosphoribosyltransferase family protein, partial [Bdellovibrionales bacterium]